LIATSSGKKHASDAQDWRWWHSSVPGVLKRLHEENYIVVVVSNQGGITLKSNATTPKANQSRLMAFKEKVVSVFSQLEFPISIYAATEKDIYRKPCIAMWTELLDDHGLTGSVNLEESFFVGDAGGRLAEDGAPKDFSSSDR
jgi:bifunctional polynucleotide phosphatase/kinase